MQAIHGLAKRRPERPRAGPSSFFRDEPPKARDRGPSANRERLRNVHPIDTGQGAMAAAGAVVRARAVADLAVRVHGRAAGVNVVARLAVGWASADAVPDALAGIGCVVVELVEKPALAATEF